MRSMAGRGRGWGAPAHDGGDRLHHALDIAQHVIVPETQHAIATRFKIGSTSRIARHPHRFVALSTVDLDHKSGGVAGEVSKIRTDGRLTAKVRANDRQMTQVPPQHALGIGRNVTHRAGAWHTNITFSLTQRLLQEPPTPRPLPTASRGEGRRARSPRPNPHLRNSSPPFIPLSRSVGSCPRRAECLRPRTSRTPPPGDSLAQDRYWRADH